MKNVILYKNRFNVVKNFKKFYFLINVKVLKVFFYVLRIGLVKKFLIMCF